MKLILWLLIAVSCYACNQTSAERSKSSLDKISNQIDSVKRHTDWLSKQHQYETKMRALLRNTGYSLQQANDTLISDLDKDYRYGSLKGTEMALWYEEHRKGLLNFPTEYYKQFPEERK